MKYWFIIFLIISTTNVSATEPRLVEQVQQRYQSITSFEGKFVQQNQISPELPMQEAAGTIAYSRPGKMRWDYETPHPQLLVTNGIKFWLYDPLLENVTVHPLEQVTQGTPLSFLLGVGRLTDSFEEQPVTQSWIDDNSLTVLQLSPKEDLPSLELIQLGVDANRDLKQIVLVQKQGGVRSIKFNEMRYNQALDQQQFEFKIPDGMEVIGE